MRIIAEETPSSGGQQVSGSAHNELRGRQPPLPNIAEPLHLNAVSITTKTVIHSEMSRVSKAQQSPTLLTTKKSGIKNKTVPWNTARVMPRSQKRPPTTPHRPKTPLSLLKYIVTFAVKLFTAQEKIIFLNMFRQQCI
jgi:hypothetical protein